MARRTRTYPVAVVDRGAINVATSAITQNLIAADGNSLDITTRAGLRQVDLAQVAELGDALHAGQIRLSTSSDACKP